MEVSFSSSFKRAFKKRIKGNADLEAKFWQKLEQFILEPFEPGLKTHKLSGRLKEFWSLEDMPKLPTSPKKRSRSRTISSEQLRIQLGLNNPTNSEISTS